MPDSESSLEYHLVRRLCQLTKVWKKKKINETLQLLLSLLLAPTPLSGKHPCLVSGGGGGRGNR